MEIMAHYYSLALLLAVAASSYAVNLGDSCTANSQCNYIINAECRDSVCQCISSTITHENVCVQPVEPHTSCATYNDCNTGTVDRYRLCIGGQCVCKPHFHWNGGCQKNNGLYEYCLSDGDCYWGEDMVGLMTCTAYKCSCVSGYLPNGKKCVAAGA